MARKKKRAREKDAAVVIGLERAAGDGCETVTAPASRRREPRRVEVHVTHLEDGRRQVVLQDLSYGPGIGWYAQKTIRLDPDQVEALLRALCTARQAVDPKRPRSGPQRPTACDRCPEGTRPARSGETEIIPLSRLRELLEDA